MVAAASVAMAITSSSCTSIGVHTFPCTHHHHRSTCGLFKGTHIGGNRHHNNLTSKPKCGFRSIGRPLLLRIAAEKKMQTEEEPLLLRIGVSLTTELLRLFSYGGSQSAPVEAAEKSAAADHGSQDVLESLRQDYARAYFLTGDFTAALYADDCLFADPTIQFRGRRTYQRNLKLLVPFFEEPSLTLFDIQEEEGVRGRERSIDARWKLRTYLRLPWKPLIEVDGSTLYVLNADSKIVKHVESWSITGGQAIQQLFVPSARAVWMKKTS